MAGKRNGEGDILGKLKQSLSAERYRHTLSVARWAAELAKIHGDDPARARLAGLLHDCAKEWPPLRLATVARLHRLKIPGKELVLRERRFHLLHAYVSAWWARREFRVKDTGVLNAIARHTLGADRMSRLDKIVYVADFSAPQRASSSAARVRALARRDLEAAFRECLRMKIRHVLETGRSLHPQTVSMWNEAVVRP
jgi:predicted HD superfamily hydrolase involved in NAD metabolism